MKLRTRTPRLPESMHLVFDDGERAPGGPVEQAVEAELRLAELRFASLRIDQMSGLV